MSLFLNSFGRSKSQNLIYFQISDSKLTNLPLQDQKPFFVNAPYSATVAENTPPGSSIFKVLVRDGDTGLPRKVAPVLSYGVWLQFQF